MNNEKLRERFDGARVPGFILYGKQFKSITHDILQAVAFISYEIGVWNYNESSTVLDCGMYSHQKGCNVFFEVTPSANANRARIEIEILQELLFPEFAKDKGKFIFTDHQKILRDFVSCIGYLCNQKAIKNNLWFFKECRHCSNMSFIKGEDIICRFCNPELYKIKQEAKESKYGYVYFCSDGEYIKIGASNKYPEKRIRCLATTYHKNFELLGYIYVPDFLKKEKELHKCFSKYRVKGEWFNISASGLEKELKGYVEPYVFQLGKQAFLKNGNCQ